MWDLKTYLSTTPVLSIIWIGSLAGLLILQVIFKIFSNKKRYLKY